MDKQHLTKTEGCRLPFSSLRLLVPPFHLMSAFMWHVLQQKHVLHYDKLEEFVSMVTETVPHLLSYRQRAQLILGLRARMVLEILRDRADATVVQTHLDKMHLPSIPAGCPLTVDPDLELPVSNFRALVLALLKDPAEKAYFFQEVFPVEYGSQYDAALNDLMWELLSCLERLLPVPDFKKTVSWLNAAPAGLKECMEFESKNFQALLQQHKITGNVDNQYYSKVSKLGTLSSSSGDCILSSLSIPPSTHVAVTTEPVVYHIQPAAVTILSQSSLGGQVGSEAIIVTDYTEVELTSNEVVDEVLETGHICPEEMEGRGLELSTENSSVVAALGDECIIEEEKIITVGQQLETISNSKEEKILCDKSTQCDILTDFLRDEGSLSINHLAVEALENLEKVKKAERAELGEGRQNEVVQQEKEVTHVSETGAETDKQVNSTPKEEQISESACVDQTVPHRQGRGRPRKNAVPLKVVQTGRRRGRPPSVKVEKAPEQEGSEDGNRRNKDRTLGNPEEEQNGLQSTPSPGGPHTPESLKTETTENPRARYLCNICGRHFTRTSDVRRHQLTHTGERPFHCTQCEKTFQHAWDLTKHCRRHHGEATFSCRLCPCSFVNLRALTSHHKKSHASELPHYCSICGETSLSASALIEHRKTHSVTHQYRCEQCDEGFDTLLERSIHRQSHRRHHKFKCPQCEKTYSRRADVKRHLLTHSGERPHQCGLCGKTFALRSGLHKHQMTHTGERPFQCPHCPKSFNLLSILHRHERMHTGERPFLCSQCGKRFLSLGELLKHNKSHVDERPYSCTQCHKGFKSKRALREHVLSHTGTRPYACRYCGKRFTKPFTLNRHHLMHTGERPFPCTQCEKTFLTSTELALHERVHTGERPYACTECPWKFRSSSELARHRRTHGQQRMFACSYCPKAYTSASRLKSHVRVHAWEEEVKCPVSVSCKVEVQEDTLTEGNVASALK